MSELSPVEEAFVALKTLNVSWNVEVGRPEGPRWIAGEEMLDADRGPFNDLLVRVGDRLKTTDRRTVAASFALRFGWASAMAIAPYLRHRCVPDVGLDNVSFRFKESTFFEGMAIHVPRGAVVDADARASHPSMSTVPDSAGLLRRLRNELVAQSAPVVEALHSWSGFAKRGTWGMFTSSWAAQFTGLCEDPSDQRSALPLIEELFEGADEVHAMRPRLHAVSYGSATQLYQRRASCCRWYLLPQGDLCASCPIVPHDDRLRRNQEWMKKQLERPVQSGGHG